MAQLIALEWDASEVRLAVAKTYGSSIHVDRLESVALGTSEDPQERLQEAISSLAAELDTPANVLLNIPRGDVELRLMELPTVPADELPEIVRLQAVRYFTALNDDWTIDFLPFSVPDADATTQNVLAAAMDPDILGRIEESCRPSGMVPTRMAIRSFSSASAWLRQDRTALTTLLVDLLEQEVDLTVVHAGQAVLSRNARLPRLETPGSSQHDEQGDLDVEDDEMVMGDKAPRDSINLSLLMGEIRRTIVAVNNQLAKGDVDQIVLLGTDEQLSEQLASGLDLPVQLYNCLDQFEYRGTLPAAPERFTALLGVLADEADGQQLALDFLHPRQPPHVATRGEKTVRYGLLSFVGLAVVAAILVTAFMIRSGTLTAKLAESMELHRQTKDAAMIGVERQYIEGFVDANIVWLDEISLLSDHFPSSDDAIVRSMTLANPTGGEGRISMDVNVSAAEKVGPMENKLREYFAAVSSDGIKPDESDPNYKTRFKQTIKVFPPKLKPVEEEIPAEDAEQEAPASDTSAQAGTANGRELN
jgi:Tfp pilus assembly PilM family ATPase